MRCTFCESTTHRTGQCPLLPLGDRRPEDHAATVPVSEIHLPVKTGIPPWCAVKDPYYGYRYSDPVWLACGYAALWCFRTDGWVLKGLRSGPDADDYDELPKGEKAKTVQWLPLPPAKHRQSRFPVSALRKKAKKS